MTDTLSGAANVVDLNEDDDDDCIDQEQLDDYREMIEQLGSFPVRSM